MISMRHSPMRVSRRLAAAICQVLIGLLLSTQGAFALLPCVDPGMSAASALARMQEHECCHTSLSERAVCFLKCADGHNLSGQPSVQVLPPHDQAGLTLVTDDRGRAPPHSVSRHSTARDPPKTIRFCTLLI
jgi:hypothetical protein